jgi:hypothetical protein
MAFFETISGFFRGWIEKLTAGQKRSLILISTAGFCVLLTFTVVMSMVNRMEKRIPPEPERPKIIIAIPADDLFLPEEPDFLPGVLLDRERGTVWNENDAAEYWQDPLRAGEEQWREKIEAAIDELLERVP